MPILKGLTDQKIEGYSFCKFHSCDLVLPIKYNSLLDERRLFLVQ